MNPHHFVESSKSGLFLPQQFYGKDEPFEPGTKKPERDYLELERLGTKLGIPVPMTYVEVKAQDQQGEVTGHYKDRSRTYNRNFWNQIFGINTGPAAGTATFGAGFLAIKTTAGTVVTPTYNNQTSSINFFVTNNFYSPVGSAMGIVVGTGTTAESFDGFAMATLIAHGNASGQLSYTAQNVTTTSYSSGTKVWTATMTRIFNNNSGGTIVVAETGMYAGSGGTVNSTMCCRDLLGATVSVANLGQLTVTYTITLTFPA